MKKDASSCICRTEIGSSRELNSSSGQVSRADMGSVSGKWSQHRQKWQYFGIKKLCKPLPRRVAIQGSDMPPLGTMSICLGLFF